MDTGDRMTAKETVCKAATYLEQNPERWIQNSYGYHGGSRCILGMSMELYDGYKEEVEIYPITIFESLLYAEGYSPGELAKINDSATDIANMAERVRNYLHC